MKTVKGFKDFVGRDAETIERIGQILKEVFERYGFELVKTPIIEQEKFVQGGNNTQDEAVSDTFKLKDKGKRKLALRYEFTFQLKRLMQGQKLPWKRYQIGPVFRDEPVSKNRLRQFTQADVDIIGLSEIPARDEAEIIALAYQALSAMNIKPVVLINNRALLDEILEFEKVKKSDRAQVLREIDKYDKIGEKKLRIILKKYDAEKFLDDIKQGEKFFKQFESYKEIISLMDYCKQYGVKVKFSPTIARGLSYYNGSIFEIKAEGIKETIVAGGSYKFNNVQCTGISFGLERLSEIAKFQGSNDKTLIISMGQDRKAIKLSEKLRKKDESVSIYYGKPSKALEYANSYNYGKVIFIGDKEVKKNKYKVKDMKTGKEKFVGF